MRDSIQESEYLNESLQALAHELKNPLINIASFAELGGEASLQKIQTTAEDSLMLIDSYLLSAQAEYGQSLLALSPVSLGSVLYDTSNLLRNTAQKHNVSLVIDDRTQDLVMTHRKALTSIMTVFGKTLINSNENGHHHEVVLRGYRTRAGNLGVGLFTSNNRISQDDLSRAMGLRGRARMPLARNNAYSNISLSIADGLCRAIGGKLSVKHMGKLSGLSTELPQSEQLALI